MSDLFVIITANKYPEGDAGAIRQHSFAKIFQLLGYTPVIIGIGKATGFKKNHYDGVDFYSVRYSINNVFFRVLGRIMFTWNIRYILKKLPVKNIKGILIVSGKNGTFKYVRRFSNQYCIPLYHDSVEWYSPGEFKNGKMSRAYRNNNNLNVKYIDSSYKVFSISSYLENHFLQKGIETIRIPVILDVKNMSFQKTIFFGSVIKIVYAGAIGGKDHLFEMVEAIESFDRGKIEKIKFCIIGITKEQYECNFGKIRNDLINRSIVFMGKIDRIDVLKELRDANFTFLLRPSEERYAKAGFPTKVVESLSTATPVICNYTSDLNLYLRDGVNSLIVENCSKEACMKVLEKVLLLSDAELKKMQESARKTAEESFDWRLFTQEIGKFLNI